MAQYVFYDDCAARWFASDSAGTLRSGRGGWGIGLEKILAYHPAAAQVHHDCGPAHPHDRPHQDLRANLPADLWGASGDDPDCCLHYVPVGVPGFSYQLRLDPVIYHCCWSVPADPDFPEGVAFSGGGRSMTVSMTVSKYRL